MGRRLSTAQQYAAIPCRLYLEAHRLKGDKQWQKKHVTPFLMWGVQDDVKNNATSINALQGTLDTLFLFPQNQFQK